MVPKLRFSEFNTPWKQVSLGEVCADAAYGMNSAATAFDGSNKYIRITDIDDESREFSPSPLTSPSGTLDNKYLLRDGDIVFARTGASVGKSYLYKKNDGKLYFAGFLIRLSINKANPCFVYNQTLTRKYHKWVKIYSMRSGQPGINAEEYKEFEFAIPSSEEQNKIADFLSSVDDKITLLNKQYDLLCRYKKEMLQKVFSQVLRFKDESGEEFPEWEPKQLSDIAMINPKNKELPSEFIYIDLESVEKGQLLKEQLIRKNDAPSRAQRLLSPGDVLFQLVRPYQKNNYIFFLSGNYVASTGYAQLRANYNPHFLYQLLHLESFTSEVMNRCTGTSYPAINSSDLASIEIEIPSEKEQIKIASFLSAIDDKIAIKKAELDRLKNWKQGLLQQMFV